MRLAPTFLLSFIASLLLPAGAAFQRHGGGVSHRSSSRSVTQRQYHQQPRALLDLCLAVDAKVLSTIPGLLGLKSTLDLCLCIHVTRLTHLIPDIPLNTFISGS